MCYSGFSASTLLSFFFVPISCAHYAAVSASSFPFQNIVLHSGSCTKTLARRSGNEPLSTSVISHISFSERAWPEFFLLLLSFVFSFLRPSLRFTAFFCRTVHHCAVFWVSRARNGQRSGLFFFFFFFSLCIESMRSCGSAQHPELLFLDMRGAFGYPKYKTLRTSVSSMHTTA